MQVGGKLGMQTLEAALLELVNAGTVSLDEARSRCPSSEQLAAMAGRGLT